MNIKILFIFALCLLISCLEKQEYKSDKIIDSHKEDLYPYFKDFTSDPLEKIEFIQSTSFTGKFIFYKIKNIKHHSFPPIVIFNFRDNKYYQIPNENINGECIALRFKTINYTNRFEIIEDNCDCLDSLSKILNTISKKEDKLKLSYEILEFRYKEYYNDTVKQIVTKNELLILKNKLMLDYNYDSTNSDIKLIDSSFLSFEKDMGENSVTFSRYPRLYQYKFIFDELEIIDIEKKCIRPDLFYLGSYPMQND